MKCAARPFSLLLLSSILHPLSSLAAPAVSVSLPLEGFYRPGHYTPVLVKAEFDPARLAAEAYLEIAADAGVPTRLRLAGDGRAAGVVPLLPMERPQRAFWQLGAGEKQGTSGTVNAPFRQLEAEQWLVGFAGSVDLALARDLLGASSVVPVRLDPADPVPGAAAAWETLDALVLDPSTPMPSDAKLSGLLAGGVTIAIRSPQKPASSWPWRQRAGCWVLSANVVGPSAAADYPMALSAVQGWQADWPRPFRLRVFLFALIFCLLALSTTLLRVGGTRPRYPLSSILYPLAILLLSAATCAILWHWFRSRSPVLERTGAIVISAKDGGLAQRDTWRFYASAREARASVPWHEMTVPFFEERPQRRASHIALICDEAGEPVSFDFRLVPGLKLGLLTRHLERIGAPAAGKVQADAGNPLAFQLGRAYLNRPLAVQGQLPPAPLDPPGGNTETWPTLLAE